MEERAGWSGSPHTSVKRVRRKRLKLQSELEKLPQAFEAVEGPYLKGANWCWIMG